MISGKNGKIMKVNFDPLEKDLACRLAYEFILASMEEDQEFENLEFINKDLPQHNR